MNIRSVVRRILGATRDPRRNNDLIQLGPDAIRFEDCFSGVVAIGATGSGKTTFLELLIRALAEHPERPSVLWCCCKSDEADRAEKVARRAGRIKDFVRFTPDGPFAVDLLGYLLGPLQQDSAGVARFFDRMAGLVAANTGSGDDKLWGVQGQLAQGAALDLFRAAGERPTPATLFDVIVSFPKDPAAAASNAFLTDTPCGRLIVRGQQRFQANQLTPGEVAAFERAVTYVLSYAPAAGDRFIGSVIGTAVTGLAPFLQAPFRDLFGGAGQPLTPDVLLGPRILALDFPASHGPAAYAAQAAFCQLTQMLFLRVPRESHRPLVIVRDEAQWLVSPDWDAKVQTIARSHGIISVTAVQGHPPMIDAFGGNEAARVRALAYLGSHANHLVFNLAADVETREHYVELFGTTRQLMYNGGQQADPNPSLADRLLGSDWRPTVGWSEQLLPTIPPEKFGRLKRGGREHDYRVQAYLFQAGRRFANGHPFTLVEAEQDLTP